METQRGRFEQLVRRHQTGIYRYARYLGAQPALAEDLVQETFLATLRPNPRQPVEVDDPMWPGWLRGIARNLYLAERRRHGGQILMADDFDWEMAEMFWVNTVDDDAAWADRLVALRACLAELPARQRELLDQRYGRSVGRETMAEFFGMTEDGIKTLLRRVRAALAQCIETRLGGRRSKP